MKIYIASSFSLLERIKDTCRILEEAGHEILVKWWKRIKLKEKFKVLEPDDFYAEPECWAAFHRDLRAIKECDALVFVASDEMMAYCGASVEIGMAAALNKPVYSIGVFRNSAMYYKIKRCKNIKEILYELSVKKWVGAE